MQIGQCYQLTRNSLDQGINLRVNQPLVSRLNSTWNDYVIQQSAALTTYITKFEADDQISVHDGIQNLLEELRFSGANATGNLLDTLEKIDPQELDLHQFFVEWAKACNQAYATVVRSEIFAKILGDSINNLLQQADKGTADSYGTTDKLR